MEKDCEDAPPRKRQRPSSSDSPPAVSLPDDLVDELLCQLPVKSLVRFRNVSKPFSSRIFDPAFARMHLRRSPTDFSRHHLLLHYTTISSHEYVYTDYPLLSFLNDAISAPTPTAHFKRDPNSFDSLIGSCDGIICLYVDYLKSIVAWNPSTRRFNTLPRMRALPGVPIYGFGSVHLSNTYTYKVVTLNFYNCNNLLGCEVKGNIHTLGTELWRTLPDFPSCVPLIKTGTFVSGHLHWSAMDFDTNCFIISLDLGNESYGKLPCPPYPKRREFETLGVLRDCLSIISGDKLGTCSVWLMTEYGNPQSWAKQFTVPSDIFQYHKTLCPLHFSEDGKLLVKIGSKLFLYNSSDRSVVITEIPNIGGVVVPIVYLESLMDI